jgi:hypothetical protein
LQAADQITGPFGGRPIRLDALRVTFTAERNLARFVEEYGYPVGTEAGLCAGDAVDQENRLWAGFLSDANTGHSLGFKRPSPEDLAGEQRVYQFFVDVHTDAARLHARYGTPPPFRYRDHDLRRDPRDICFKLGGGDMMGYFGSNTVRIPAAAIRAALGPAP